MTIELKKQIAGKQYRPSSTARPVIERYVVDFADIKKGEFNEILLETGINSANPAILVPESMEVYVNRGQGQSRSLAWLASERNQVVTPDTTADKEFNDINQSAAIAWFGTSHGNGSAYVEPQFGNIDKYRPIFEEELFVGFGVGMEADNKINVGNDFEVKGQIVLVMKRYKVTQKQWLEIATDNTTGNRFI